MIDITGKTYMVTGASNGMGLALGERLAKNGATVIMLARNKERGEAAVEQVKSRATGEPPQLVLADMGEKDAVLKAAVEIKNKFNELHCLINNAGTIHKKLTLNSRGIEKTCAVNFLGSYLLTEELLPLLKQTGTAELPARVVNVSSMIFKKGELALSDLNYKIRKYGIWKAYSASKLALNLYTIARAGQWQNQNIPVTMNAVHPGFVATRMSDSTFFENMMMTLLTPIAYSIESGIAPIFAMATERAHNKTTAKYFNRFTAEDHKKNHDENLASDLLKFAADYHKG